MGGYFSFLTFVQPFLSPYVSTPVASLINGTSSSFIDELSCVLSPQVVTLLQPLGNSQILDDLLLTIASQDILDARAEFLKSHPSTKNALLPWLNYFLNKPTMSILSENPSPLKAFSHYKKLKGLLNNTSLKEWQLDTLKAMQSSFFNAQFISVLNYTAPDTPAYYSYLAKSLLSSKGQHLLSALSDATPDELLALLNQYLPPSDAHALFSFVLLFRDAHHSDGLINALRLVFNETVYPIYVSSFNKYQNHYFAALVPIIFSKDIVRHFDSYLHIHPNAYRQAFIDAITHSKPFQRIHQFQDLKSFSNKFLDILSNATNSTRRRKSRFSAKKHRKSEETEL